MLSHLAVAVDFSTPSQLMVKSLGHFRAYGADQVTLIHVHQTIGTPRTVARDERYYQELLDEMEVDLSADGWEVETRLEAGRPGTKIIDLSAEIGADMLVLANHGHAALQEVVLGSVASEALERSEMPVFLFSDEAQRDPLWERIVHPTDFSTPADKARQWAQFLSTKDGSSVTLLHGVDDRYHGKREAEDRRRDLDEMAEDLRESGLSTVKTELVMGRPRSVVCEAAEHYPQALFIMGAHGRGWLGDLMLGGVSRAMARRGSHHLLCVPA